MSRALMAVKWPLALCLVVLMTPIAVAQYVSPPTSYAQDGSYDRKAYKHWIDADKDCQDTRQEVLIEESVVPVTLDKKGCRVIAGEWHDEYTGKVFTDPKQLDVDHRVPLRYHWYHGGRYLTAKQREEYANDLTNPDHLIAVESAANRAKGAQGPDTWLPPVNQCIYIRRFIGITLNERWNVMHGWREVEGYGGLLDTHCK